MIGKQTVVRVLAGAVVAGVGLIATFAGSSSAGPAIAREIHHGARVAPAVFTGSVRSLPPPARGAGRVFPAPRVERETQDPFAGPRRALPAVEEPAAAAQPAASAPAPAPSISFKGLDLQNWGDGWPPDTVGDVGPTHFVQAVNTSVGIFRKSDGVRLAAFTFNSLWSAAGTGTSCDVNNYGDPTVVYDPLADRWIVADFAFEGSGTSLPYYECIAVSRTSDPVGGGWYLYAIRTDDVDHPWFADYPKMGIWPDGLYMTANMFSNTFEEVRVWAFNRADLEAGAPVRNVVIDLNTPSHASMLPANMRTAAGAPPAGRPNLLVAESQSSFAFEVWKFHVDYSGSGSTFTGPTNVSQASWTAAPSTVPSPGNSLDSLNDRLMMQAQYANIGGNESLWVNHTVACCGASSPAGIQWAQLDVTGGTVSTTPVQQQLYPPANDGLHRWMGSLAVDKRGDMALGYSVSNKTTNPDIRYAGRLAGDPPSTLPQTETSLLPGVTRATQSGACGTGKCIRWGDYSAMTIDPDGCTFWYTQEYYEVKGLDWQTRIGSFSFPSCSSGKLDQTISFGGPTAKTYGDPDFTVSATASSGLPVSFSAAGNCTVSGSLVHITGAGSCSITASQPGDATYNPAPDVAQTFPIAKANQTIGFAPLPDKTYGDPDFTVSATATSGLAVSFGRSGNCTVSGATVHITGAGSCTVTASQPGDSNYNAATPVSQTFAIAKADQTIGFGPLPDGTYGDPDFTLGATASSGLTVTFGASGSCTVSGSTLHITGAGSCTVTASQGGDSNYNAAAPVAQSFAIAKASQTIAFAALADRTYGDPDFAVAATASSGLTVAFTADGSCTVTGTTVHIAAAGSCSITAAQPGDSNYDAAPTVIRTFSIAKAGQTITFPAIADTVVGAPDFDPGATASSGLPVGYAADGPCSMVGTQVHVTGVGTCTVTASQGGDANYAAATDVARSFSIKSDQTIEFAPLSDRTYGDPDFTVTASASSGLAVSFAAGGDCTVDGSTVHLTGAGTCTVTASQPGDADYFPAPDVARSFAIAKAAQAIVFDPLPDRTYGDVDFPVAATASSGLPVSFAATGSCTVSGSTVHLAGAGSCTVTASHAGDSNHLAAADVSRSFSIAKAGQTISFEAPPGKSYGDADFAVAASASSGLPVAFAATGTCTVAGSTVHITGAGACTLTASQPGNANYNAAADVSHTFAIAKAGQTISFAAPATKTFGDPDFTVAATASSGLPVTFLALGSCTLAGSTVGITGAGSCTVTASQGGDADYAAAAAVTRTFAIARASRAITFAAIPDKVLGDADFSVAATASSGLAVVFGASGSCTVAGTIVHLTSAGTCTLTASQPGDANYAAAPDVTRSFSVGTPLLKPAAPSCRVPKVVGKRLAAARLAIKQRHCRTGRVRYGYSRKVRRGVVTSQSRRPGRILPAGSKVSLVVSRGRKR